MKKYVQPNIFFSIVVCRKCQYFPPTFFPLSGMRGQGAGGRRWHKRGRKLKNSFEMKNNVHAQLYMFASNGAFWIFLQGNSCGMLLFSFKSDLKVIHLMGWLAAIVRQVIILNHLKASLFFLLILHLIFCCPSSSFHLSSLEQNVKRL